MIGRAVSTTNNMPRQNSTSTASSGRIVQGLRHALRAWHRWRELALNVFRQAAFVGNRNHGESKQNAEHRKREDPGNPTHARTAADAEHLAGTAAVKKNREKSSGYESYQQAKNGNGNGTRNTNTAVNAPR